MAKREWLYCGEDWDDVVNIIKLTKNPKERLQEFNNILKREDMTIDDIFEDWPIEEKENIENSAETLLYEEEFDINDSIIYWFFNIYTGEALHIKYSLNCSGIIKD